MKLAVSACLLGQEVRYDGGHKLTPLLTEGWGKLVEFIPICPEVEAGLPVPREPVDLFTDPGAESTRLGVRALGLESAEDYTEQLEGWCRARLPRLANSGLQGFILKSRSPSCGKRVPINPSPLAGSDTNGRERWGSGLFAEAVKNHFPLLPVADETELEDLQSVESFLARLFILHQWRNHVDGAERSALLEFHLELKDYFVSLDPNLCHSLSQLAERSDGGGEQSSYLSSLMALLGNPVTTAGQLARLSQILTPSELALIRASERFFSG